MINKPKQIPILIFLGVAIITLSACKGSTKINVSIDAVWYVGQRSYPCTVKYLSAKWIGVYGITVSGQIICSGGHTQAIMEGFTVPEHLRGRKDV